MTNLNLTEKTIVRNTEDTITVSSPDWTKNQKAGKRRNYIIDFEKLSKPTPK